LSIGIRVADAENAVYAGPTASILTRLLDEDRDDLAGDIRR
jgi:hypothetical protein